MALSIELTQSVCVIMALDKLVLVTSCCTSNCIASEVLVSEQTVTVLDAAVSY